MHAPHVSATPRLAIVGKGVEAVVAGQKAWVSSPRHAAEMAGIDGEAARRDALS